ncbi:hypothetical protein [Paludisphaera sp.]|uniref:hypothetical protein n=1 Tax=Paludisphaera sp. TaxID=2017432 RepID=UPI00301E2C0A
MGRKSQNSAADAESAEANTAVSNAQAVRDAMAEGLEALDDIDAFVRDRYGKEIPRQQISAYKSQARRKAGEAPRRGGRTRGDVEGYLAPPGRQATDGDLIEALQALKPLVAKVGAENVKKLADLLS